jgi:hypothetical protein
MLQGFFHKARSRVDVFSRMQVALHKASLLAPWDYLTVSCVPTLQPQDKVFAGTFLQDMEVLMQTAKERDTFWTCLARLPCHSPDQGPLVVREAVFSLLAAFGNVLHQASTQYMQTSKALQKVRDRRGGMPAPPASAHVIDIHGKASAQSWPRPHSISHMENSNEIILRVCGCQACEAHAMKALEGLYSTCVVAASLLMGLLQLLPPSRMVGAVPMVFEAGVLQSMRALSTSRIRHIYSIHTFLRQLYRFLYNRAHCCLEVLIAAVHLHAGACPEALRTFSFAAESGQRAVALWSSCQRKRLYMAMNGDTWRLPHGFVTDLLVEDNLSDLTRDAQRLEHAWRMRSRGVVLPPPPQVLSASPRLVFPGSYSDCPVAWVPVRSGIAATVPVRSAMTAAATERVTVITSSGTSMTEGLPRSAGKRRELLDAEQGPAQRRRIE